MDANLTNNQQSSLKQSLDISSQKPQSKRPKILLAALLTLFCIAISVFVYFVLNQKKNSNIPFVQVPSKSTKTNPQITTSFFSGSVQSINSTSLVVKDSQGKLNTVNLSIPTPVWLSSNSNPTVSSSSAVQKEESEFITKPNVVTQAVKSDLSEIGIGVSVTVFINKKDNQIISQEVLLFR